MKRLIISLFCLLFIIIWIRSCTTEITQSLDNEYVISYREQNNTDGEMRKLEKLANSNAELTDTQMRKLAQYRREKLAEEQKKVQKRQAELKRQYEVKQRAATESKRQVANKERIRVLEEWINGELKSGIFYKIQVSIGDVWIEPIFWNTLNVDQKHGMIRLFEEYFELKNRLRHATIRDKWNNEKLGGTGWTGPKIYK